jgi:hypothetical protein
MLGGRYEVESFLGQGGMGAVYKGLQMPLRRPVAIKILAKRGAGADDDFGFEERFKREAYAMAALTHPHIVQVYDCGDAGENFLFISMELVEGGDLSDAIKSGAITPELALTLIQQICDGLQAAHERGLVHRDIKPANIFLTGGGRAKVADFGLAKKFDAKNTLLTKTGLGMGTPDYAAPEQYEGAADIDHRADIYSLGVMFYQMLTGSLPRGRFKPPSQRVAVDPRLDAVVARAMEADRSERYQGVAGMKAEIQGIVPTWNASGKALAGTAPTHTSKAPTHGPRVPSAPRPGAPRPAQPSPAPSPSHLASGTPVAGKSKTRLIAGLIGAAAAVAAGAFFLLKKPDAAPGGGGTSGAGSASTAVDEAFMRAVANASSPEDQVALVEKKIEAIGGIPISASPRIENGRVVGLTLGQDHGGDQVKDFSPVAALRDLTRLNIMYLNPADLSFLTGMKLSELTIHRGLFTDVSPLRDLPLTSVTIMQTRVADWSVLEGKPLRTLMLGLGPISDISFVRGMPLTRLHLDRTQVTDLSPIRGLPLTDLTFELVPARDAGILRSIPTLTRINGKPAADFWTGAGLPAPSPAPSSSTPAVALPQFPPPVPAAWVDLWEKERERGLKAGKIVEENSAGRTAGALFPATADTFSDGVVRVTGGTAGGLQLILRNKREGRMYRLMVLGGNRPHARFEVFENKTQSIVRELARTSLPQGMDLAQEHEFQFAMTGDSLRGWVDGTLLMESRDSELTSGTVGCYIPKGMLVRKIEFGDLSTPAVTPARSQVAPAPVASATPTPAPVSPPSIPEPSTPFAAAAPPAAPSAVAPPPPADPRLAQLEAGFKSRFEAEAQVPYTAAVATLNQNYVNTGIARARATAQQKGILVEVTALDAEKARIEKNEPLPPADPDTLPESLKQLRATYRTALARHEADRARKAAPLYDLYLKALDDHAVALTRENKIEDAQKVKALREEIHSKKLQAETSVAIGSPDSAPRPGAPRPATAALSAEKSDADTGRGSRWYEAASWVVSVGGVVKADKNGAQIRVTKESDIPAGRFGILDVDIMGNPKSAGIKAGDFMRFSGLKELRYFRVAGVSVGDEAFAFLSTTPAMEVIILSGMPVTDAVLAHMAPLTRLTDLQIQGAREFTGAGLEKLVSLPALKTVWFNTGGFNDVGAKAMAGAKSLETARWTDTAVTDEGVEVLGGLPNLREAYLGTCKKVGGRTLASWSNFASLRALDLSNCPLDAGVFPVIGKFTNLTRIDLNDDRILDDQSLVALKSLTRLTSFAAARSSITGVGFSEMTGWKSLTRLALNYETPVSAQGLAAIVASFPKLEELHLGKGATLAAADWRPLARLQGLKYLVAPVPSLDDAALAEIAGITSLDTLQINETAVTGKGLAVLKPLKALTRINVAACRNVDDTAIPTLKELKGLKELTIRGSAITADGAADLKKALPGCNVISQ